jgi:hypothetical protein
MLCFVSVLLTPAIRQEFFLFTFLVSYINFCFFFYLKVINKVRRSYLLDRCKKKLPSKWKDVAEDCESFIKVRLKIKKKNNAYMLFFRILNENFLKKLIHTQVEQTGLETTGSG